MKSPTFGFNRVYAGAASHVAVEVPGLYVPQVVRADLDLRPDAEAPRAIVEEDHDVAIGGVDAVPAPGVDGDEIDV